MRDGFPPDPLHGASRPDSLWSTTNVAEAVPGVPTPLGWTFWSHAGELALRRGFRALGTLSAAEATVPDADEERIFSIFFGRVAMRVDFMCQMGDRMPGTSGTAVADQIFSSASGVQSRPARRYYPLVALRLPLASVRAPKMVRRVRVTTDEWWRTELSRLAGSDLDETHRILVGAWDRFADVASVHALGLFSVIQPIYDQFSRVMKAAGATDAALTAGYGGHEETQMLVDFWDCSRGDLDFDEVLARHGYHGPREGEISSVVWREHPAPLKHILDGYRGMADDADPRAAEEERISARHAAQDRLVAGLPAARRLWARAVLRLAEKYLPLRSVSKVAFLQCIDVGRAAARRLGLLLAEQGILGDPADVFYLTADELRDRRWAGTGDLIAQRRDRHRHYQTLEVPNAWTGMPEPRPANSDDETDGDVIQGIGAGGGTIEGPVRVVTEPGETDMEPGEILVAHITDPSWASVLFLASALVTDIGGELSHAAIVARELGVPCVVNTKVATRVLRTGDVCRVDGSTGQIEILKRVFPPKEK
jgi:pyruvate,water dikinase